MTYVVTENCIQCKYTDCVDVCPVDCFHEGEHMLVIDPEVCIDCGVCEPECPISAIQSDTEDGMEMWVKHNKQYASQWSVITIRKEALPDAQDWKDKPGKYDLYYKKDQNLKNKK